MTVITSKEFVTNQKRYFDMAINENIIIKRGKNLFHLICSNIEDDDYANLIEAKALANDEDTNLTDFKVYVSNLTQ